MGFYDNTKEVRALIADKIAAEIQSDFEAVANKNIPRYFSDEDTYIRKNAYLAVGRIYFANINLQELIIKTLENLLCSHSFRVRQTVINAAGEIGITDFSAVERIMETGLEDKHHSPRNAVIGSLKKMGEKNPVPVLGFARKHINHPDAEIRREICHGIELRGRTHPQEVLPLLKELEYESVARVKNMVVHVLGQIAYKKGCLETVVSELKTWGNKIVAEKAYEEIIDVHKRYKNFSYLTAKQAREYIEKNK